MFEIMLAGGWLMLPILFCSVIALAIVIERLWALRKSRVIPQDLVTEIWVKIKEKKLTARNLTEIQEASSLGRVLVAGLTNMSRGRDQMKEAIEDAGRHEMHRLERYLNTLGTVASISPMLGLLGTVTGMIKVFTAISAVGVGNAGALSTGISEALLTTAFGLAVAIPALLAFRYLRGRVDGLVVYMEQEALKMIDIIDGKQEPSSAESSDEKGE